MDLVPERFDIDDYDRAVELFYERHWTDGLPVVLPTRRRVEALIDHAGRDPQESPGAIPPKGGEATIENIALRCRAHNQYEARLDFGPREAKWVREASAMWNGGVS